MIEFWILFIQVMGHWGHPILSHVTWNNVNMSTPMIVMIPHGTPRIPNPTPKWWSKPRLRLASVPSGVASGVAIGGAVSTWAQPWRKQKHQRHGLSQAMSPMKTLIFCQISFSKSKCSDSVQLLFRYVLNCSKRFPIPNWPTIRAAIPWAFHHPLRLRGPIGEKLCVIGCLGVAGSLRLAVLYVGLRW